MAWVYFNPNPWGLNTDDCTVRALCTVLGIGWDEAHELLSNTSRKMGLMPSNKKVMWSILMRRGFRHEQLPDLCPDCYAGGSLRKLRRTAQKPLHRQIHGGRLRLDAYARSVLRRREPIRPRGKP